MTLHDAISILRTRWMTVAVVTVVATLIAVAVAFFSQPQYSASTNIFVATPEVHNPEQAYAASRFAQDRATSYRDVIASESLTTRTIARLQLKESPRALARRVKATVNPESVLLKLSVTDSSPSDAVNLANALSDDFVRMVKDLEAPVDGGTPVARAVVIKSATAAVWVSPDRRKIIGFGVLAGVLLGGVAALVRGSRKPRSEVDDGGRHAQGRQYTDDLATSGMDDDGDSVEVVRVADDEALR